MDVSDAQPILESWSPLARRFETSRFSGLKLFLSTFKRAGRVRTVKCSPKVREINWMYSISFFQYMLKNRGLVSAFCKSCEDVWN